ncbi:hypothetical protein amrb99_88400 [Actinomadura sp. RB99]|uniref:hypothetical protein n=1 Tax=Actinomadura sp. RB99 TaxID=2691577 RepID=UPI0016881E9F|nr:hypothetical protein [Actinomadura sp. RB99]MBD2899843.1 hypothetical protein [Actinomadura sp. RB99]
MARVRWWGTGVVVLVLLILGLVLPLVDKALGSGGTALAAGTVIAVGTERAGVRPVTFTVPAAGWALDEARSSLTNNAEVTRGEVRVDLNLVVPLGSLDNRRLWDGLGRIIAMGGAQLRGGPSAVTTRHGMPGLTGALAGHGKIGSATVFTRDDLGATVTASGPPDAYGRLAGEVRAIVLSVEISP